MSASKKDKMDEDLLAKANEEILRQTKLAKEGKLVDAIENLLVVEKQTRQAEDHISTGKLAVCIVTLCYEAADWKQLNHYLQVLAKRRGQLKPVIQEFVKATMSFLDHVVQKEIKLQLLNTLISITEGKMFVEIERARLTRILAKIKEQEGKINEAADILQEVQVETFGQMDKLEKTDYILEQMRLCLEKQDYIKTQILSNKISRKMLGGDEFQEAKIRFFSLMIRYYSHDRKFLDICRSYMSMYDTPNVKAEASKWSQYLKLSVIYIVLAPFDNEQSDLMHRISEDKNLSQLPEYKKFLTLFITKELIRWPVLEEAYRNEFNQFPVFSNKEGTLWVELKKRVVEHNIRVIAEYYQRITMKRLTQLLDLPANEAEQFVAELMIGKSIFAKIDRPQGIISFRKRKDASEILNEWANNIGDLLSVMEKTTHLIQRENMVYKVAQQ